MLNPSPSSPSAPKSANPISSPYQLDAALFFFFFFYRPRPPPWIVPIPTSPIPHPTWNPKQTKLLPAKPGDTLRTPKPPTGPGTSAKPCTTACTTNPLGNQNAASPTCNTSTTATTMLDCEPTDTTPNPAPQPDTNGASTRQGGGPRSPAAETATGAVPRFITNAAGDTLDTTRITIPEGKFGYLLKGSSKSGVFRDSMGFDQASLDSALRSHLVDNFGGASESVPMTGGGMKFTVRGPMTGPSGQTWNVTTAWGVDPNGTIRLITATP